MGISPGTERSIKSIADRLPILDACLQDVFEGLKALTDALNKQARSPLSIELTADEWVELANAAQLKADRLRKDELPDAEMTQEGLDKWADTLESAYKKIASVLKKNGIPY